MEKIRQQDRVIRSAEVNVKGAARQHVVTVLHAGLARVLQRHSQDRRPVQSRHVCLRILFRDFDAEKAVPAAMSSTFIAPVRPSSTTFPSGPANGAIIGAMLWANSTQMGFSGSTLPSPGRTVRPFRTMSERCSYGFRISGFDRNCAIEARQLGDVGSRNAALEGVC